MSARMTSFVNDGLEFDVVDTGPLDGEVVVLLHGFPQTASCWRSVAERLNAAGYRTIMPTQRGYSPHARPKGRYAYRIAALTGDIVALIGTLGVGPIHLVGHDWGATVAWATAARHPHLIRTLTTVSVPHSGAFMRSMLRSNQALRSYYMALFQIPRLPELIVERRPAVMDTALERSGMDAENIARVRAEVVESGALTGALNWYRAIAISTPSALSATVPVATTHVWGAQDIALARSGAELTAQYVTGDYSLRVLPEATHWIPEQNPDQLTEIIIDRMKRATPPDAPR
ncbi:alpha/beta fold hydrolase [Nocardia sp. NPDC050710]|uniref:alpha/beta fold hydrolase n=1 Tax=Nocardia sp. NPDC050710 TaxID=3157220 RepID=UPI0033F88640